MPKRLHGHHQIFNRGRTLRETGLPVLVTDIERQLSNTGAPTTPDTVCGAASGRFPLPGNRQGRGRGGSGSLGRRTARHKGRQVEPSPAAQCPAGAGMAIEALQTQRTNPGRQPLLLVSEQVKAECAGLTANTVQTLSVAQGADCW